MAQRISYDTSAQALLRPHLAPPFFEDWSPADFNNPDLLAAECSRLAYADHATVQSALLEQQFELHTRIGGDGLRERKETGGTEGFIADCPRLNITLLAFRGTEPDKPEDILTDSMTSQVPWPGQADARVHAGFLDRFQRVQERVLTALRTSRHPVVVTGHSLGAALATLAAAELDAATLITFGSPRVGNASFARHFSNRPVRRYVNCCDIVTRVPPERFSTPQLALLLDELGAVSGFGDRARQSLQLLNKAIAGIAAASFTRFDPPLEFQHVSPAIPILDNGTITTALGETEFTRHQDLARKGYPHRLSFARFSQSVESLLQTGPGNVFASLFGLLSGTQGLGPVLSRDLADHAIINYISAFTGRLDKPV